MVIIQKHIQALLLIYEYQEKVAICDNTDGFCHKIWERSKGS